VGRTGRLTLVFIVICTLSLGACAGKSELDRVADARGTYRATLNSFFVKEVAPVDEVADVPAEGEEAAEGDEPVSEDAETVPEPVRQDAVLDVIVQHDTTSPLAGLTLDIEMVEIVRDAAGAVTDEIQRAQWLYWVDTEGLQKANQRPYSVVFEDVDYEEGFAFFVEVRHPVPASDRGDYREFDGLDAGE